MSFCVILAKYLEEREPESQKPGMWIVGPGQDWTLLPFSEEEEGPGGTQAGTIHDHHDLKQQEEVNDILERAGVGRIGQKWRTWQSFTARPAKTGPTFQASAFLLRRRDFASQCQVQSPVGTAKSFVSSLWRALSPPTMAINTLSCLPFSLTSSAHRLLPIFQDSFPDLFMSKRTYPLLCLQSSCILQQP